MYLNGRDRPKPFEINRHIGPILKDILWPKSLGEISLIESCKPVVDDTTKFLVFDEARKPCLAIIVSSPFAPESVFRNLEHAATAARMLGKQLAYPILCPLAQGHIEGLSYAVWEYCNPLSEKAIISRVQNLLIRCSIFDWLRQCTIKTVHPIKCSSINTAVLSPLNFIASNIMLPAEIRKIADWSIKRVLLNRWRPCNVLMHNDFWRGNILIRPRSIGVQSMWFDRFVVIDWSGAVREGTGLYDLLRMAGSLQLPLSSLKQEVYFHCNVLGCAPEDAISHLLSSLGRLGLNLEHFPQNRYVRLVTSCFCQLMNLGVIKINYTD